MNVEESTIGVVLPNLMASSEALFKGLTSVCDIALHISTLFVLIDDGNGAMLEEYEIWLQELLSSRVVEWNAPTLSDFKNLNVFSDIEFKQLFRFEKKDVLRLHFALGLEDVDITGARYAPRGLEALLILLRRLSYPGRLCDMARMFNKSESNLSIIFNSTVEHLVEKFYARIMNCHPAFISRMNDFAKAVDRYSMGKFDRCVAFVDGTIIKMCKPTTDEDVFYTMYKKSHGIKFQAVVAPDGMVVALSEADRASVHDNDQLSTWGFREWMHRHGAGFYILGDPAYALDDKFLVPFRDNGNLTRDMKYFNIDLSSCRVSVEHYFGRLGNLFSYLTYERNLKVKKQPLSLIVLVAFLLTNCHGCLYGNQTAKSYKLNTPHLEDYLNGLDV